MRARISGRDGKDVALCAVAASERQDKAARESRGRVDLFMTTHRDDVFAHVAGEIILAGLAVS
jgi:hypothetical protein